MYSKLFIKVLAVYLLLFTGLSMQLYALVSLSKEFAELLEQSQANTEGFYEIALLYIVGSVFFIMSQRFIYRFISNKHIEFYYHSILDKYKIILSCGRTSDSNEIYDSLSISQMRLQVLFNNLIIGSVQAVVSFGVLVTMLLLAPYVSLFLITSVSVAFLFGYFFVRKRQTEYGLQVSSMSTKSLRIIKNLYEGYLVFFASQNRPEEYIEKKLEKINWINYLYKINALGQINKPLFEFSIIIGIVAIVYFVGSDPNVVQQLILIGMLAIKLVPGLNALASAIQGISANRSEFQKVLKFFRIGGVVGDSQLNNSTFSYNCDSGDISQFLNDFMQNHDVLIDYDNVPEKGLIAIVGDSGSGKTTLIESMLFWLRNQGCNVSFMSQKFSVADATIAENLFWPDDPLFGESKFELAQDLQDRYKDPAKLLSGGQQTRVSLIRCIDREADEYILDEPTTGLDRDNTNLVCKHLNQLSEKSRVWVVTHNSTVIENALVVIHLSKC
jgi:ABC-type lipoprotein export system ATPase subunit